MVIGEIVILILKYIIILIYNDEGDFLVGWNLVEEWRVDVIYVVIVVKVREKDYCFFCNVMLFFCVNTIFEIYYRISI